MTSFDKREEGFERAFTLQEEFRFKARARRNRRLGDWAAEQLGLSGQARESYITALVERQVLTPDDDTLVAELEGIVDRLEKGNVALEESISLYERGEVLKARCEALLKDAEMRIEKIALGADGKPKGLIPLDEK